MNVISFSNTQGSLGGSLSLTITGQGFSQSTFITICDNSCVVKNSSIDSITCSVKF